jgi:hypothetical protein
MRKPWHFFDLHLMFMGMLAFPAAIYLSIIWASVWPFAMAFAALQWYVLFRAYDRYRRSGWLPYILVNDLYLLGYVGLYAGIHIARG